jgi:hypothetical protein
MTYSWRLPENKDLHCNFYSIFCRCILTVFISSENVMVILWKLKKQQTLWKRGVQPLETLEVDKLCEIDSYIENWKSEICTSFHDIICYINVGEITTNQSRVSYDIREAGADSDRPGNCQGKPRYG